MYEIYKQVHEQCAHGRRDKCLVSLAVNYTWSNRKFVQKYINICHSCQNRQSVKFQRYRKRLSS